MFDAYREIFQQRGDLYNAATRLVPDAREAERAALIERLGALDGRRVLDLPAGGGYLADGIAARYGEAVERICVEPSPVFAEALQPSHRRLVAPLTALPLADACVDAVGSLAGLHHFDDADKRRVLAEMVRVLRPGGRIAVADVRAGSDVAAFLNGPVDRGCATGHQGMFLADGFLSECLAAVGLVELEEVELRYSWRFPDRATMARYCWNLFGMTRMTEAQVLTEIEGALRLEEDAAGVGMGWGLRFVSGRRP